MDYEVGYKKPPKKHRIKPGEKKNPNGRPPIPPEVQVLRRITATDVAEIGQMIIMGDVLKLEGILRDRKHPDPQRRPTALQVWIASCALKAINKGDSTTLNNLLDRFVGRIPAALLVATVPNKPGNMTSEEAQAEAKRLLIEAARDD
jgi:hypothetical protein